MSIYGYYRLFNYDPWFLSDKTSLEKRLYGDDAVLITSALALPQTANILVFKQYWIANYYLYPRKLFYISPKEADEAKIKALITDRKIEWMFVSDEKGLVKLAGTEQ